MLCENMVPGLMLYGISSEASRSVMRGPRIPRSPQTFDSKVAGQALGKLKLASIHQFIFTYGYPHSQPSQADWIIDPFIICYDTNSPFRLQT